LFKTSIEEQDVEGMSISLDLLTTSDKTTFKSSHLRFREEEAFDPGRATQARHGLSLN
jgi:hypothetical protein